MSMSDYELLNDSECRRIIIDTDIGVDDAFALRAAMLSQDLIGITTVCGNVTVDMAVKNAKLFCHHYGLNIPVLKGASRGLTVPPTEPIFHIHGADGLGGVYDNPFDAEAPNAVQYLIDTVRANPGEITICAIGPLTNIALALNLYPNFAKEVRELVVMGGAFGHNGHTGNMSAFAEFNFWKDPHAADQVFSSALPITVLPLDVTCEVQLTGEEVASTNDQFLTDISRFYLDFSLKNEGFFGMAVHDALTIAYLNWPELFTTLQTPVRVVTEGITFGQSVIPNLTYPQADPSFAGLEVKQICIGVKAQEVKERLLALLRL